MLDPTEIQNLSELLLSKDNSNTKIAFEIIEQQQFPKELITEIFAVYKLTEEKEFKTKAALLLKENASQAVQKLMQSRVRQIKKNNKPSYAVIPNSYIRHLLL